MGFPSPTFKFTIPSIHDDTILNCRLYLSRKKSVFVPGRPLKAAIIAHPYAPLGGCYDDPIVDSVGGLLLKSGYAVGTFNFRGASGSAGHTSWSAKPELADYVSFYGFMIFYLNGLVRGMVGGSSCAEEPIYIVPAAHATGGSELLSGPQSRLILAGYSYGSIIAYHLPNSNRVIHLFETCSEGSAEQEIQLKASHLSSQTLKDFQARQEYNDTRENVGDAHLECLQSSSPLVVGGFESAACEQRIDKESRRSLNVRRSLDRARGKVKSKTHRLLIKKDESDDDSALEKTSNLVMPQICYLLISPVLPPMASLLTLFSSLSFKGRERDKHSSSHDDSCELTKSPSLAVFGNKDVFTSAKKVRTWAEKLSQIPGSTFQHREIDGAGHFWRESGVLEHMKNDIKEWESSL